jgi:uncharacterized protein DUF1569
MSDVTTVANATRKSVDDFVAAARAVPEAQWAVPRAPGKWSPGQVAEHVALAFETSGAILRGPVPGGAPKLLRPVLRLAFNWVLKRGDFPRRSRSPKILEPAPRPAAQPVVLDRLRAAADAFERAATAHAGAVDHPMFGKLPVASFIHFQEIHTRHHQKQLA